MQRLALTTLLLALAPATAAAMSPPIGRPARIAMLEGSTELGLESAHTVVRCAGVDECEFETRYVVRSESERLVTLVADGHRIAGLELAVNGANVLGSNITRENENDRELPAVTRTTRRYEVQLQPGESTILLRGAMNPRGADDVLGVAVSLPIRHPLLAKDPGWQRRNFLLDLSTLATWGGRARSTFKLDMPDGLDVRVEPEEGDVDASKYSEVSIWTAHRPTQIVHGGPYIGFGVVLDEPGGWFGRLGYEFGLGMWNVLALAVDFTAREVVVSPTVHVASAGFSCIFPSFGLGVGPALQLGSTTTVGARGLAEMQLPFIGLVASLDWYPGLDSPDRIDFALLGRLSF